MGCGGNDAENNHTLRNYRINHHRAEHPVVLSQILGNLGSLGDAASVDVDRGHAGLCLSDVETKLLEAVLDGVGNLPALLAALVTLLGHYDFQTLDIAVNQRHRKTLGIHL